MTTKAFTDLTEEERAECKQHYMDYVAISEISRKYNVPRSTISYHAHKYWSLERDMEKAALYSQFSDTKRTNFIKMSQASITIITRSLEQLATRSAPPTVHEARQATAILESLDKITRLDDGSPTEIVEEKPMSFKDIDAIASLNPFAKAKQIEDAEYEELNKSDERNKHDKREQ